MTFKIKVTVCEYQNHNESGKVYNCRYVADRLMASEGKEQLTKTIEHVKSGYQNLYRLIYTVCLLCILNFVLLYVNVFLF